MGVPPEQVFYVPNGVDGSAWDGKHAMRRERSWTEVDAPCILLYTRFFEFPVPRAIDVLRRVRERVPEARLMVVGEGLFGEEAELFELAAESGLSVVRPTSTATGGEPEPAPGPARPLPDVIYKGWVPFETLPSTFSAADVAIYPFDDTLINRTKCAVKLGDLLAAGLPVVAEGVGQNREYIRSGETGILVEPGNGPAFADAVVRLLQDGRLREQMGRAAARDVRKRFGWHKLVGTVERAYGMRGTSEDATTEGARSAVGGE
jgi:glycosyltransferase involved in cell wall biosynthesis